MSLTIPHPTRPAPSLDQPGPANSIGFLRLLLASLVVYVHCIRIGGFEGEFLSEWSGGTVSAGLLAVQCFFVLSGALIAASWNRTPRLGRYLWHRALRLLPAFWVCLLVTAFVFTPLLHLHTPEPRTPFFKIEPSAWDYVWRNLFQPRTQIAIGIYPNNGPWAGDWNGSLWTLFYEGACYLMIAALGLLGLLKRWRTVGAVSLLGVIALYSFWTITHAAHPFWLPQLVNRLFDTPGKELTLYFFAGSLWSIYPGAGTALLSRVWVGPLTCGLLVVCTRCGLYGPVAPWLLPVVLFWLARVLPFARFEQRVGGDYSYGVYVYGYPAQQVLAHFRLHEFGFTPYLLASLLAAGLCGIASWHGIEKPMLRLKHLFARPKTIVPSS